MARFSRRDKPDAAVSDESADTAREVSQTESDESYITLRHGTEIAAEFIDRKSRFIAQLMHVETAQEADEFLATVQRKHYDARHNVPAWILADGQKRARDDGEPQRTSGLPTLEVLQGAQMRDVCCIVTRYFGGTLLGPGGLVRAYATATQRAVEQARAQDALVEMARVVHVRVKAPYELHNHIRDRALRDGAHVLATQYADTVTLHLVFRAGCEASFVSAVQELARGKQLCSVEPAMFAEF